MAEYDTGPGENELTGDHPIFDSQYFGPFPTYDPPQYSAPGPPVLAAPPGSSLHQWAPPSLPVVLPAPTRRRGLRPAAVIGLAALTAVVIGGAAGFGGAKLADLSAPAAPAVSPATIEPAPSDRADPDPSPAASSEPPLPPAPAEANTTAVAKRALPSTVMIEVGNSTGSGFVLDTSGHIMTNNHVVAAAAQGRKIQVVFRGGKRQSATLVGRSPSYDIAVIKVKSSATLKPLAIGNSDQTEVGQPVIAIGAPLGLPGTVTQGIVSAVNRPVVVNENADADTPTAYINGIQTDASINPGNSGGPMLDSAARVIGVNSAILTIGSSRGQTGNIGLGFAIPINQAKAVGAQLIDKGRATYPVIGANVATTNDGVEVTEVEGGGPAARAGLRKGDLIAKIDGQSVAAMEDLVVAIRTRRPGQVIALDYSRGSARDRAKVTLGSKVG